MGDVPKELVPSQEWHGLISAEDWQYVRASLSVERRRDLLGVLRECPAHARAEIVAEIRSAPGFRDRAMPLALARVLHDAERSSNAEPDP